MVYLFWLPFPPRSSLQQHSMCPTPMHQLLPLLCTDSMPSMHCDYSLLSNCMPDGEFACLTGRLPASMTPNICSADEHIPEIEQFIHIIKECCQALHATLPFISFPPCLIIEMVYHCVFWLNSFPPNEGVSNTLSPVRTHHRLGHQLYQALPPQVWHVCADT